MIQLLTAAELATYATANGVRTVADDEDGGVEVNAEAVIAFPLLLELALDGEATAKAAAREILSEVDEEGGWMWTS